MRMPTRRILLVPLILAVSSLSAAEPVTVSRTAGSYEATVTLTSAEPQGIQSIVIRHGRKEFSLPTTLFDDLRAPHVGPGFKAREFQLEVKRKQVVIRLTAGDGPQPDDHAWFLPLPLKDASRITRFGDVTGSVVTRPAMPLSN